MKIRIGEMEADNFLLFIITLLHIANQYLGFVALILYLFYAYTKKTVYKLVLPVVYLAINMAIGDLVLVKGINYFQIISTITFVFCVIVKKSFIRRLTTRLYCNIGMLALYVMLMLLCIFRIGGIRIFFALFLLTFIIIGLIDNRLTVREVCDAILVAANQIVWLGLLEFILQRTFFYSSWTGGERYRYGIIRIGSTASDPNYICMILVPLTLLSFFMFRKYSDKKYRTIFFLYIGISILTMSRMGWLCVILALYFIAHRFYFDRLNRITRLFMNILSTLACFAFLYTMFIQFMGTTDDKMAASNFTRNINIQYGLLLLTQNFWTGIGMNSFYEYAQPLFYQQYGGHFAEGITVMNMPLEVGLAFGFCGIIIFILLILGSCIKAKKMKCIPCTEMLTCFLAMSMSLDGMTIGLFWILLALPRTLAITVAAKGGISLVDKEVRIN